MQLDMAHSTNTDITMQDLLDTYINFEDNTCIKCDPDRDNPKPGFPPMVKNTEHLMTPQYLLIAPKR